MGWGGRQVNRGVPETGWHASRVSSDKSCISVFSSNACKDPGGRYEDSPTLQTVNEWKLGVKK